jgi:sporulation protein YlmC with PRC-barrel domain
MDFRWGADVRGQDGAGFGDLRAVIFDRETGEVSSLSVAAGGMDDDLRLVPIGAVNAADPMMVETQLSDEQFATLPAFNRARNIAPPPLADNLEDDEEREPEIVPDIPPIGAATGIESIAFTPVIEEEINIQDGDAVVDATFTVRATDGDLGQLAGITVDDQTRRITLATVSQGMVFPNDVDVPAGWLREIGLDWIAIDASIERVQSRQAQ